MASIAPTFTSIHDLLNGKKLAIDEYEREYK